MFGGCSTCGGKRVFGMVRHTPRCEFYRVDRTLVRDTLAEHPDLIDLDLDTSWWYPGEPAT